MTSPIPFFSGLTDPRMERTRAHRLEDILFIAIASVICGAESWNDMEDFGRSKEEWLRTFLSLENGIPSHDTFNRVFSALDPAELEASFMDWTRSVAQLTDNEVISVDGKTMRGTRSHGSKSIVHMVSAWAGTNRIVLGQQKVEEKSNEITAIPRLLSLLAVKGCIVTIDAMGCQKGIAAAIVEKEADYVLAVKANQLGLLEHTLDSFRELPAESVSEETDCGHGRVETRRCTAISDLTLVRARADWPGLRSLVMVEKTVYDKCRKTTVQDMRLYISSLDADAELLNRVVRSHWAVENSLHWVLDVAFNEDHSRKRARNAAQNFSLLNRIALNLLKSDRTAKVGVRGRRLKAGWDNNYLLKILKN